MRSNLRRAGARRRRTETRTLVTARPGPAGRAGAARSTVHWHARLRVGDG
jgi:hypothetical protein